MAERKNKIKVHSLTGRSDDRLMREAFQAVKRNRGAAGVDKVSIAMFEKNLDANLDALQRDLKTRGKFVPKPLRRVWIPKDAKGGSSQLTALIFGRLPASGRLLGELGF